MSLPEGANLLALAAVAAAALPLVSYEARAAGGLDRQTKLALADLRSPDAETREKAVRRLRLLASKPGQHLHAVPALVKALSDDDPMVRVTAAEMLRGLFNRPDMPDSPTEWEDLWRRMKDRFANEQDLDAREVVKRERARLENDKGYHFMMLGSFKVAERYFLDAVANYPQNPQYWNNLGKCLSNQGRFPDAVDRFRRALEEDPGYVPSHYNLAEAFLDITHVTGNDRTYEALGHAEVALRLDKEKTDWAARWLKARILLGMALAEVRAPREGLAAERHEMYKRASSAIDEAIHIAPNVPEVRKTAALVYYGRELYFRALKHVRKVYDLGYTMDEGFLKKLEKALRKEAYEIGATPPEMPKPKADAKGARERSPALLVPYRDGTL
jgi:tetratricopeptide (TPR) repeat protein